MASNIFKMKARSGEQTADEPRDVWIDEDIPRRFQRWRVNNAIEHRVVEMLNSFSLATSQDKINASRAFPLNHTRRSTITRLQPRQKTRYRLLSLPLTPDATVAHPRSQQVQFERPGEHHSLFN